ncbi:MAG: SRPBCC domain-containing protein [Lewinellaceae bacterium]|nr:SRPBCC domain-containing protein [Saprospiraceae bacterium]MCB9337227.1 SRPBCC domain-containing protein [Lewinellaceae bacterium]
MERKEIKIEYLLRASPSLLYQFFTTPSNLVRWFCEEVDIQGEVFTFTWSGYDEVAQLVEDIEEELVKFSWLDEGREDEFLQFRISISPVTGETILEITDFCDADEVEEQKDLWETQIGQLKKETGSGG